jgi:hypothetical protein
MPMDIVRLFEQKPFLSGVVGAVVVIILLAIVIDLLGGGLQVVLFIVTLPFRIVAALLRVLVGKLTSAPSSRELKKDGTSVEGVNDIDELIHYDPLVGLEVPPHHHDEKAGKVSDLPKIPVQELKKKSSSSPGKEEIPK